MTLAVTVCALAAAAACSLDAAAPPTDAVGQGVVTDAELDAGATVHSPDAALLLPPVDAALSVPDAGLLCTTDVPYALRQVAARGFVFDVWVAGPDDGEAVLLLHGFPESSFEWRRVVPVLVARGYRVIAPDRRGYTSLLAQRTQRARCTDRRRPARVRDGEGRGAASHGDLSLFFGRYTLRLAGVGGISISTSCSE